MSRGDPPKRRQEAVLNAEVSWPVWWLSRTLVRLWSRVWLRLSIRGLEHVPRTGPLILVANHASYLDPPLIGITVPRYVRFLAQAGLARFPPLRWWLRCIGVSLIDRDAPSKEVLRFLVRTAADGGCVSVFAEGTRSRDGSVAPFRSGIEFLVRRTGAPVVPVGIEGTFRAFPRGAKFVAPRKCAIRFGAPWSADRVLAPGGVEALRRTVAGLARAPLQPPSAAADGAGDDAGAAASEATASRVGQGRGPAPTDPPSSAGGRT